MHSERMIRFMFVTELLYLLATVHPICTTAQFNQIIKPAVNPDQEVVIEAIFEQYLDDLNSVVLSPPEQISPVEQILFRQQQTDTANEHFITLLSSLEVVDHSNNWNYAIANLRRVILLEERQANNPWINTTWPDLPSGNSNISNNSLALEIDSFLKKYAKEDQLERFGAMLSRAQGDADACRAFEQKVMRRWFQYYKLIESAESTLLEKALFPQLTPGTRVKKIVDWIKENIRETKVIDAAKTRLYLWENIRTGKQRQIKSIVLKARNDGGFDPWSNGCGGTKSAENVIKNQLLKISAEIQELDSTTFDAIAKLLNPEQREAFQLAE